MALLRNVTALLGVGVGCIHGSEIARSDRNRSDSSWLGWLVPTTPTEPAEKYESESNPQELHSLKQSPGKVLVWGGAFGRIPREITSIGNQAVRVAVGDGIGATIDAEGAVHGFAVDNEEDTTQKIRFQGSAVDVAMRESAREVVILDSGGKVHTSQLGNDGIFKPAETLNGAMRRAKAKKVHCGREHCVAITKGGEAISWGSNNSHGQLANGSVGHSPEKDPHAPGYVQLPDKIRVRDVACGDRHTVFLDETGTVYAAGDDQWAQLGISAEPWLQNHQKASGDPRKAELLHGLAGHSVAGGGQHTVILVRDGTVFSCGFNQWGQLGHHNYSSLAPPSPITDYRIRAIAVAAGENHSCVVEENGEMLCIGGNEYGQLGLGTLQPSMVWKKVKVNRKPVKPTFISSNGNSCAAIVNEEQESK